MINQHGQSRPWVGTYLWLIFFWPVGIIVLFFRFFKDKTPTTQNSNGMLISSIILYIWGILFLLANSWTAMFILFICGLLATLAWQRLNKKVKLHTTLYSLVMTQGVVYIDTLANSTNSTYEATVLELQTMGAMGYFPGASIDPVNRALVFPQVQYATSAPTQNHTQTNTSYQNSAPIPQPKNVNCPGCGAASSVITGQTKECEYCGSPIVG